MNWSKFLGIYNGSKWFSMWKSEIFFLEDLVTEDDANDKTFKQVVMYGVDWPH